MKEIWIYSDCRISGRNILEACGIGIWTFSWILSPHDETLTFLEDCSPHDDGGHLGFVSHTENENDLFAVESRTAETWYSWDVY